MAARLQPEGYYCVSDWRRGGADRPGRAGAALALRLRVVHRICGFGRAVFRTDAEASPLVEVGFCPQNVYWKKSLSLLAFVVSESCRGIRFAEQEEVLTEVPQGT